MPFYLADDISNPWADAPSAAAKVVRDFTVTIHTALGTTLGFLINDFVLLSPLPTSGFVIDDYFIDLPATDSSTSNTWSIGDSQVLSTAVQAKTSGAQTTPAAAGTSFTLTASASTAGFTATYGLLSVGGCLISYESLSGSTFVTCYASQQGFTIPSGATIQQAANWAAYNATAVVGQNAVSKLLPWGNITGTTATAATAVVGSIPAVLPRSYTTGFGISPPLVTPYNLGPLFFTMKCIASPGGNPTFTTQKIKGWVAGHFKGY